MFLFLSLFIFVNLLAHLETVSGASFHHECDEILLTSSEVGKLLIRSIGIIIDDI